MTVAFKTILDTRLVEVNGEIKVTMFVLRVYPALSITVVFV